MSHYETLGVAKDADASTLKRAYRKKAAQMHPDKATGNKAAFQDVQRAYAVLKDTDKRAQYDEFGDAAGKAQSLRQQAESNIALMAVHFASTAPDIEATDMVFQLRQSVETNMHNIKCGMAEFTEEAARFKNVAKRLTKRGGGASVAVAALEQAAVEAENKCKTAAFEIEKGKEMLKVLEEHQYKTDQRQPAWGVYNTNSMFGITIKLS